jgi:hypothetical protein
MNSDKMLEHIYWNLRAALDSAQLTLHEPHPLWSELNELMESMPTLENYLDISNCWESIKLVAK